MTKAHPRSTCDLCDDHGSKLQILEPVFQSYGGVSAFFGAIETIRCHEDNSRLREMLATRGAGRILVVDGGGSRRRALFGDQLGGKALSNNWAGLVIHGAVRDVQALSSLPIGVLALCAIPIRGERHDQGDVGVEVSFAGVRFVPGAMLYADANGVIVSDSPVH